jgi:hypothetical protein
MGREDHGLLSDSKNQWWVECPNDDTRIPLSRKPEYCPFCGDKIGVKGEEVSEDEEDYYSGHYDRDYY